MERELSPTLTAVSTMVTGRRINSMARENLKTRMVPNT